MAEEIGKFSLEHVSTSYAEDADGKSRLIPTGAERPKAMALCMTQRYLAQHH